MTKRSKDANPMDPTPVGFESKSAKVVKKTTKKATGKKKKAEPAKDTKQDKLFNPGEDFAAYEKRIRALLRLRTGLIKEVRAVKGDLEWLFLDAISLFEHKTGLRIKKIELDRDANGELSKMKFDIGF